MNSFVAKRREQGGFTLIELLVVMAIIATLAGLGMVGIPAIIREADKTAAKDRLKEVYRLLMIYDGNEKRWPREPGAKFPLAVLESNILDRDEKSCEIFFDPSLDFGPGPDCENCTEDGISWTGPSFEGGRRYSPAMRNANKHVIVCNKVPPFLGEDDLDFFPHAGKGIVYLTAGGAVDWMAAGKWWPDGNEGEDYPVVGPESQLEQFARMVPYETCGDEQ